MHARKISRLIVNDSLGAFYLVETQVCILGGGVGGLWLQLELSNRGFHTIVVDHKHLGAFASTRNQGWLHSGAFYMVLGGTAAPGGVAKLCWQSSARLRQ